MSNSNILIPISDEQAKAIQEALKTLQGFGGFLSETFGTVPQDVVGLLGGGWLKVRRAENLARILDKARERLRARRLEAPEPSRISQRDQQLEPLRAGQRKALEKRVAAQARDRIRSATTGAN